jgi:hypothetical protein
MEKSGACNIDVICPVGDAYNNQDRAVANISTGGSTFCSGSLINNTANDARPFFLTAAHCGINAGNAASLVTFWNYFNSTCRPQGPGQSPPGDGQLNQFNTGAFFRAAFTGSDVTLVELDDAPLPAFNVFFAGWDRTPNPAQFTATVAIHHPSNDEMRITFAPGTTESGGWPPAVPGDGSHVHAIWGASLGVTEPGSSGSPLYTQQGRYIGQLHGGPSACGAGDLSDYYGRFSVSWTGGGTDSTRLSNWLDPANTGQITLDGRDGCALPAAPTGFSATANGPNAIQLNWSAVGGATGYNVYRAVGACPQPSYTLIAPNVTGTTYNDVNLSGGITYSYVVRTVAAGGCESLSSTCDDATATGGCTSPPTFAGATSVTQPSPGSCRLDVNWAAGTSNCPSTTLTYNVYRSTDPVFVPSPSSLRQSCVNALTFADTTVTPGSTYYYIVRAEDSTTGGTGACNNGNQDANLARQSGNPDTIAAFSDDIEGSTANWVLDSPGAGNPWAVVTTASHSPTHAWFSDDPAIIKDKRVAFAADLAITAGAELSFWHRINAETNAACTPNTLCDGGVLEYSTNGGTTWFDILAGNGGTIPANPARITQGAYTGIMSSAFMNPIGGRLSWGGDNLAFAQVRVNLADFAGSSTRFRWRFATDNSVSDAGWWVDDVLVTRQQACTPAQTVAPFGLAVDAAGNGVLQPAESATVSPAWRNTGGVSITLTGAATNFTGPAGPTYTIDDATAAYGTIAIGANASCSTGGDCYAVTVTGSRPQAHWDSTIDETVSPTSTSKTWTLHVGDSFTDVTGGSFYRFIETIFHKGITGGCATDRYCPTNPTTREQMAAFVLVAKEGAGYNPPACTTPVFTDVPASSPFCKFIEELARRGVTGGCGTNIYCPQNPVTREQMAVFVLRTLDPNLDPPACTTPIFTDVPASSPFCRWVEELVRRGVVSGCDTVGPRYCPTDPVTREQMGVFLTVTFSLTLYGL